MKKALTVCIAIVTFSTLALALQQQALWQNFSSPEGKFNVLVPSKPEVKVEDVDSSVGKITLYTYSSRSDTGYFLLSYGDYPSEPSASTQQEAMINRVRDGVLEGLGAEIVSEKRMSVGSYPGLQFTAKKMIKNEEIVFNWRAFLVGRRLYQLAVITGQRHSDSPELEKFFTSFDLTR